MADDGLGMPDKIKVYMLKQNMSMYVQGEVVNNHFDSCGDSIMLAAYAGWWYINILMLLAFLPHNINVLY